ncbi:carbohydrate porin [Acidisoma sp.]|uniref:carbohydrate porin n=1 Tax=Acidisoma sp. TaxID=1872115 RepID=UPI003B009FE9
MELTYQGQLTPWLQLQPDAQFVFDPGGGILDPNNSIHVLRDEIVAGVRTNVTF